MLVTIFSSRYDAQDSMKDSVDVGVIKTPSPKGRGLVSISYFINCTHECCCFISWRCVSTYSHPREACPVRGKDNLSCMNGDIYNLYIVSIDYFFGACPTIWLCQQATKQRLAKLEALQDLLKHQERLKKLVELKKLQDQVREMEIRKEIHCMKLMENILDEQKIPPRPMPESSQVEFTEQFSLLKS